MAARFPETTWRKRQEKRKRNVKIAKGKVPLRKETKSCDVSAAMGPGSSADFPLLQWVRKTTIRPRERNIHMADPARLAGNPESGMWR
jgi:hypothetical protein